MDEYPRHVQRKRHYPLEVPANSSLKLLRVPREWAIKSKSRASNLASDSSLCPMWTDDSQHTQYQYPHQVPPLPLTVDHIHPFRPSPHLFRDFPSAETYQHPPIPSPPQGWNLWNWYSSMQPLLKPWYPGWKSAELDNNFVRDIQLNQINLQVGRQMQWQSTKTRGGSDLRCWSRSSAQHIDHHSMGRLLNHRQLSAFSGSDHRRQYYQQNLGRCKDIGHTAHIAETLHLFMENLKEFPIKENAIQTIENCITASHLPLKTSFVIEKCETNKPIKFFGALYINDIFIIRSSCIGKKMLKHKVYDAALQLLKTKSADDFMAQHSLKHLPPESSSKTEEIESGKNDLKGKLLKLQEYIKNLINPQNVPIIKFDKAFTESHCGLSHRYQVEAIRTDQGIHMYTRTRVVIEDKAVALALSCSKKESKVKACQKAVSLFTSTDIDTIIKEYFEGELADGDLPQDIQLLLKKHRIKHNVLKPYSAVTKHEQEECLDRLILDFRLSVKPGVTTVMTIDKNCVQMMIKLLAVYKIVRSSGQPTFITCDLYILDHLISQGKGTTRKMAQTDAYSKAGEVLKKSKGADILTTFPKFHEEELSMPEVLDIVYKGYNKVYESNHCRLNRLKQLPEEKRKISELVIIEHQDWAADRKKHAHCILNQSATQCGCLLEWTTEPEDGCFRCTMKLQGEEIASVLAKQRKTAVNIASSIALFNLYETQPVIQGFHLDYVKVWVSREELLKCAASCQEDCQNVLDVQINENQEVNKISRAMLEMLDTFFNKSTLADFVGAPDWTPEEKKLLRFLAIARGLRVVTDVYCEERVPVINRKYDLSEMVNILEKQPNKTQGRYRLLPHEEKPSYDDIAGDIAANESVVKQYQIIAGVGHQCMSALESADNNGETDIDNYLNDDLSFKSKDSDAFVTADSSFFDVGAGKDKMKDKTTPRQMISEIPLPTRTSTPVKVEADTTTQDVDELDISKQAVSSLGELSLEKQDELMSPATLEYCNEECSHRNVKFFTPTSSCRVAMDKDCTSSPASNTVCSILPLSLPSIVLTQESKSYVDQTSQHCTHPLIDFQRVSSSRTDLHRRAMQPLISQPQSQLQRKFNRSIDLEAGMNESGFMNKDQYKQQGQYCSNRQQMEQQKKTEQELQNCQDCTTNGLRLRNNSHIHHTKENLL